MCSPFKHCHIIIFIINLLLVTPGYGQDIPAVPLSIVEQQLENLTESIDDAETEDDGFLQQITHFIKEPLNLNTATESDLKELGILTPLQVTHLIAYRNLFGNLISIYELQAVPSWNISLIRKLRPYVTVSQRVLTLNQVGSRLHGGEQTILLRVGQVLEKSKGYKADTTMNNFYPGSPQKILLRYKYQFKNLLQYGITAEKDAGEQFFKGGQRAGFDFYSAHLYIRNTGIVKSLVLGDFIVNMGQGLTQWQGLAFKKSADVLNIKRQADVLRPYNSSGEIAFNRGAGITIQKRFWEATAFISYRKLDANFIPDSINNQDYVSSLEISGYHRTKSEIADKNIQGQFTMGGNISYSSKNLHVGLNGVYYNFSLPIIKGLEPYNLYALSGRNWGNYSIDYSYTYKNLHFFGEAATDKNFNQAFVNGLLISTDARVDMSFLYRRISKAYQSLYSNAFTESTFPTNENGFYAGISVYPGDAWRVDAYADLFRFPWLKYRVDAPVSGSDYLIQVSYKPNKQVEVYSRYRVEKKSINLNPSSTNMDAVVAVPRKNWRTQWSYKINPAFTTRSRVELLWYGNKDSGAENGFLTYIDIIYKPLLKPYSANARLQYFETDGYNSRLYAFENDVLYSYSIPVFYDKGFRYYINMNYDVNKYISLWVRFAQSVYPGKSVIGSGLDEITDNKKTELKLQAILTF